jgi:hypothetical protein
MAGREMTAWLSFISANLGSLEMMGWAGSTYQYGILALHAYWIGAIPAMLFLGLVMMPFYYISKTYSVPRISASALRQSGARLFGDQLRLYDHPDERHQYVLDGAGDESGSWMGPQLQHLAFFAGGCCSTWRSED